MKCYTLTIRSPNAYRSFNSSKTMMLPCNKTLQNHKNAVHQQPGIVRANLLWMYNESMRRKLNKTALKGGLLLDEMSIQDDFQIVRKNDTWKLIGAVDMGEFVNSLDYVMSDSSEIKLATHVLQYMFVSHAGFRWPTAFYGSNNASAYQIYYTFWELVKELYEYGFEVEYCMLDGSVMNRNFTKLMFHGDPLNSRFCCVNPFFKKQKLPIVQDIKHCLKKIRNSILSSSAAGKKPEISHSR